MNNLKLEVENQIAVLTITRPAALNALNRETLDELKLDSALPIAFNILTGTSYFCEAL